MQVDELVNLWKTERAVENDPVENHQWNSRRIRGKGSLRSGKAQGSGPVEVNANQPYALMAADAVARPGMRMHQESLLLHAYGYSRLSAGWARMTKL
ncbi:MAG: hypothetical protein ACRDYA_07290 [Egibacteraceae bacterium]